MCPNDPSGLSSLACLSWLSLLPTRQYHRIAGLPFFRQYRRWKPFSEWKAFLRMRKRAKCRAVLQEDLFQLHPCLRVGKKRLEQPCPASRRLRLSRGIHQVQVPPLLCALFPEDTGGCIWRILAG